jgi:hypothetical protein
MPYVVRDNSVYRADTGKKVGSSKNVKKYLKVLNMIEHGVKPNAKR